MKMIKYLIPAVALMFGLASCDNMDELYKDYRTDVSIYSTKITGLSVQPGFKRAILTWNKPKDAIAKGIEVSWNDGENVVTIDSLASTYEVKDLDGLTYTFVVKSIDAYGNRSLAVSTSAKVYGDADLAIMTKPKFAFVETANHTHALNIKEVSGAMNMWGGKFLITLTGAEKTVELDLSQEFNPFEQKSYGYYARMVETTYDLGEILPAGEYKIEYEMNTYATNFRQKTGGIFYYNKICYDAYDFSGEATAVAEEIVAPEPEPETPEEETPAA
ncbi:MAG: hypothetical protein IJD72_08025 [Alistipes sp.]|nr:hypothetical protein [Alistipes sp.]